jgi:hypothetical protein
VLVDDSGKPFQVTTETASDGYRPPTPPGKRFTREHDWDREGITAC